MCNGDSQGKIPHSLMLILLLNKPRVPGIYNYYYKKSTQQNKKGTPNDVNKETTTFPPIFCNLKTNFWRKEDLQ